MTPIATDAAPAAIGPYAQAIQVDDWIFTSGQLPLTLSGEMAAGIEAQTEQVFDNLAAVLGEAGTSLDHVVKAKGLAGRQAGFGEVALDAAPGALGDLVLGQGGEEAGGGPALLVGAFGEARPDVLDRRQAFSGSAAIAAS